MQIVAPELGNINQIFARRLTCTILLTLVTIAVYQGVFTCLPYFHLAMDFLRAP